MTDPDPVFTEHGVEVAYLFGSRAEGSARPDSDHDVAVLFGAAPDDPAALFSRTARLGDDLAAALGTPVDVVDLDRADLELRGRVSERGRLLFSADEARRVRFEVDARMRWIEFRPMLEEAQRAFLRRVAERGLG